MRARRRSPIPVELRSRRRWVRHTDDKVPLTTAGRLASSTNASTWSSWHEASASPAGVGIGYVLAAGDGVVCVDLDHCIADGQVAPWARELLDRMPGTYVEISRSGDGLHIFGLGEMARGRKIRDGERRIEVYGRGRFIAVTGRRLPGRPSRLAPIDLSGVVPE